MDKILPSHPESNLNLLKRSLKLYKVGFTQVYLLSLFLSFIIFIPRFIADWYGQKLYGPIEHLGLSSIGWILLNLASIMIFVAILWHMHCISRGKHEPLAEDFTVGLKRMVFVLLGSITQSIIIFAVFLLTFAIQRLMYFNHWLFLPGNLGIAFTACVFILQFFVIVYVFTLFVFLTPLIAVENRGVLAAIERSVYLAWNHVWRIFSLQVLPWLSYFVFLILLKVIFKLPVHIYFLGDRSHSVWITLLQTLIFSFFAIWIASLLLIQLRDLELRKHITKKEKNVV